VSDVVATEDVPRDRRWLGLDVLRGGIMIFLAVLVFTPETGWRGHPEWWGWRPSDAFFPGFLTVAGAALALQTRRGMPWMRLVRRFLALVVLGLLYNAITGPGTGALDLTTLRYPGVLQRIALVGLLGAVVVWALRRRAVLVLVAAVVLALGWGLALQRVSADCPDGVPDRATACGTYLDVDERVFGGPAHVYQAGQGGHDPEGLASTAGALATFLVGYGAARLLLDQGGSVWRRIAALLAVAAGALVLQPLLLQFAPVGKRMWTPGFVGANAAAYLAGWALLTFLFDTEVGSGAVERMRTVVAAPFVAVGRNSLVLWIGMFVVEHALLVTPRRGLPLRDALLADHGATWYFVVFFGGWLAVAGAMHAARWHVRL
jgi:predicted acyltransferase